MRKFSPVRLKFIAIFFSFFIKHKTRQFFMFAQNFYIRQLYTLYYCNSPESNPFNFHAISRNFLQDDVFQCQFEFTCVTYGNGYLHKTRNFTVHRHQVKYLYKKTNVNVDKNICVEF